jgi:hypothetical protein
MDQHVPRTVLWAMYGRLRCLNAINKIIDVKTKWMADPFGYNTPDSILKLIDEKSTTIKFECSTRQYLDRIVERMSITQVVDAVLMQDDPERFYPLEKDIEKFITDNLIKNGRVQGYKLDIPGFIMTFNMETAIAIRRHELNKK